MRLLFSDWFSFDICVGDSKSCDHVPIACKDAVAIFYMFDLTSRCTLNRFDHHHKQFFIISVVEIVNL